MELVKLKKEKGTGQKGLIQLRAKTASKPMFHCSNCRCDRYSPCTCQVKGQEKKGKKKKKK